MIMGMIISYPDNALEIDAVQSLETLQKKLIIPQANLFNTPRHILFDNLHRQKI